MCLGKLKTISTRITGVDEKVIVSDNTKHCNQQICRRGVYLATNLPGYMNIDRLFATPLTRRQLTTAIGLTAANLALSSCTKSRTQESPFEQITGGEIITLIPDFQELINEQIRNNEPVTANPTIIKSTVYHGRIFNGDSQDVATASTRQVAFTTQPVYSSMEMEITNGISMIVISPDYYKYKEALSSSGTLAPDVAWYQYIRTLLHEVGHMTAPVKIRLATEQVGNIRNTSSLLSYGFSSSTPRELFSLSLADNGIYDIMYTFSEIGKRKPVHFLEELYADVFSLDALAYVQLTCPEKAINSYSFLTPGLKDLYALFPTDEQAYWQNCLKNVVSTETMKPFYQSCDRQGYLQHVSDHILEKNPNHAIDDFEPEYKNLLGHLFLTKYFKGGDDRKTALYFLEETLTEYILNTHGIQEQINS